MFEQLRSSRSKMKKMGFTIIILTCYLLSNVSERMQIFNVNRFYHVITTFNHFLLI